MSQPSATVPSSGGDSLAAEERERLTAELRRLLAVSVDDPDGSRPRAATGGVGDWLVRSEAFLFSGRGPWSRLTGWGSSMLTELLTVSVQNRTRLGPSVGRWMRDYLVPVLFPQASSDVESPQWELVRLLLLALLENHPSSVDAPHPAMGA